MKVSIKMYKAYKQHTVLGISDLPNGDSVCDLKWCMHIEIFNCMTNRISSFKEMIFYAS